MRKICLVYIILMICPALQNSLAAETSVQKDSGKIAFCQHDGQYWQIWIMDLQGANRKQLTHSKMDKRSPDLSSDGRKIVYVTNDGRLWVMDSDGKNNTHIPLNITASEPKWCFQDKRIVFTSYRGLSFLDDSDIWIINSDGTNLKKLIRRPSLQFLPDVSADGQELLFVDVLELAGHEIYKFNLQSKDYIQLTENRAHDTSPIFTPDAQRIVYSSDEDGSYDIWIMDKFGQHQQNLTHRPAFDSSPVISGDGKTIFFLSDSTNSMQIWSIELSTGRLRQITNDGEDKQDISVYVP